MESTSRVIITYGASATYKSSNLEMLARSLYEQTGKPSRLVSAEASSLQIFQPLVDVGIVDPLYINTAKNPLHVMSFITDGMWPTLVGEKRQWMLTESGKIAAYFFEGMSSISELFLGDISGTKQRKIAQDVVGAFEEGCNCNATVRDNLGRLAHKEDCHVKKFAHAAPSHYGFVQNEILRQLKASSMLPVDYTVWSAHEAVGEEADTRKPIRGPGLVGKAKTASVQKYCGTLLHFEGYSRTKQEPNQQPITETKVRAWYQRHPDKDFATIEYPAKVTMPAMQLEKLEKKYPGGFFEPGREHGLDEFVRAQEEILESEAEDLEGWKAQVDNKFKEEPCQKKS